jgi:hypothetical protein
VGHCGVVVGRCGGGVGLEEESVVGSVVGSVVELVVELVVA